jgi:hypothetical protein
MAAVRHFHVLASRATLADPGLADLLTAHGAVYEDVPFDKRWASVMGLYWNAIDAAMNGNAGALTTLTGTTVRDRDGNRYRLLTDINDIQYSLDSMTRAELQDFNRALYTVREARRAS